MSSVDLNFTCPQHTPKSFLLPNARSSPSPLGKRSLCAFRTSGQEFWSPCSLSHTPHIQSISPSVYIQNLTSFHHVHLGPSHHHLLPELQQLPPSAPAPTVTSQHPAPKPPTASLLPEGKPKCSRRPQGPRVLASPLCSTPSSILCPSLPLLIKPPRDLCHSSKILGTFPQALALAVPATWDAVPRYPHGSPPPSLCSDVTQGVLC